MGRCFLSQSQCRNGGTYVESGHGPILPRQTRYTKLIGQSKHVVQQSDEARSLHQRPSPLARQVPSRVNRCLALRVEVGQPLNGSNLDPSEQRESAGCSGGAPWTKKTYDWKELPPVVDHLPRLVGRREETGNEHHGFVMSCVSIKHGCSYLPWTLINVIN